MPPTTAELRRFLTAAFSDEELKTLCFDYFRDVYDDFAAGMTKGQMIQLLIERCDRRAALANLEAALRAERPDQYAARFGVVTPVPAAPTPAEPAPVRRDPHQVFLSHAHEDAAFAHRLAADLEQAGWRVWIAPDSIQPGEKWVEAISRGLEESGVFIVVLTPAGVASRWVRTETNAAIELENRGEVRFIPLEVAACQVPALWNVYQRVPFGGRYEDGLRALLARLSGAPAADVARALAQPRAPEPAPRREPLDFDWVTIPAGEFLMGSDKRKDELADDDETPQHTVYLPEFRIARTPVTVAQFAPGKVDSGDPLPGPPPMRGRASASGFGWCPPAFEPLASAPLVSGRLWGCGFQATPSPALDFGLLRSLHAHVRTKLRNMAHGRAPLHNI